MVAFAPIPVAASRPPATTRQVFVDGRAQQLYREEHVRKYLELIRASRADQAKVAGELEQCGTDAVLLPTWSSTQKLAQALRHDPRWAAIFQSAQASILVRQGSALMDELTRRESAGDLWWPDAPETEVGRGVLWATRLGDQARAAEFWRAAIARKPLLGTELYAPITDALLATGQPDEAARFLTDQKTRLASGNSGGTATEQAQLLRVIQDCERKLPPTRH